MYSSAMGLVMVLPPRQKVTYGSAQARQRLPLDSMRELLGIEQRIPSGNRPIDVLHCSMLFYAVLYLFHQLFLLMSTYPSS